MSALRSAVIPLLLTVALAACGGDSGTGPDDGNNNGGNNNGGTTPTIKADPSFAADIQEIFNRRGCSDSFCHGSGQSAGLDLRSGAALAELVNVPSTQTGTLLVIPGNADGSYLIMKVEGRAAVGARMPVGGAALSTVDLTNLKNWINQGAKNN